MARLNRPHFTWPFERRGGHVAVAEQGSQAHINTQIYSVVATPLGYRAERPEFGWPFPEFAMVPLELATLQAAIANFVPDADVHIEEWADAASQAVRHIRIEEKI